MAWPTGPAPSTAPLFRRIWSYPPLDWLALLFDLYRYLRQVINRQHQGMYEILDYDLTLELTDQGRTALLKKQLQVKFLQDEVMVFPDYTWGDGDIFPSYRCAPGKVVERRKEGDRWNSVILFPETKNKGEITPLYIEWTTKNSFTGPEEMLQVEIRRPTKRLKVTILFPPERQCQRAVLIARSQNRSTVLGPAHFSELPDGRQRLIWETTKIKQFEIYNIKWRW